MVRFELIAFDLDGTLLEESSCWNKLHAKFETLKKAKKNMEAYCSGRINYSEFVRRDTKLWTPIPSILEIERILMNYTLKPFAKEVFMHIKYKKMKTAIITAGLDLLANKVGRELGADYVVANKLLTDENGFITGESVSPVDLLRKDKVFLQLLNELQIEPRKVLAVGDSKFDKNFLHVAGYRVAIGDSKELGEIADVTIKNLRELLPFLD
ncbi:MAG: HAD family hydrolase [Candidatus Hodarchaeota archaeon]